MKMTKRYIEMPTYKRETIVVDELTAFKENAQKGIIVVKEDCFDPYWLIPYAIRTKKQELFENAIAAATVPLDAIRYWRKEMYSLGDMMESKESDDAICPGEFVEQTLWELRWKEGGGTTFLSTGDERWAVAERLRYNHQKYYGKDFHIESILMKKN